jgi:hypothetical protein
LAFDFFLGLDDCFSAFAVGAPADPGLRILSPLPDAILFRFAWMLAHNPFRLAAISPLRFVRPITPRHFVFYICRVPCFKTFTSSGSGLALAFLRWRPANTLLAKTYRLNFVAILSHYNVAFSGMITSPLRLIISANASPL